MYESESESESKRVSWPSLLAAPAAAYNVLGAAAVMVHLQLKLHLHIAYDTADTPIIISVPSWVLLSDCAGSIADDY